MRNQQYPQTIRPSLFENTIVGPIHSRRFGSSLGVNLLPLKHKHCSYDCIYCECGWNSESERQPMEFATPDEIAGLLERRLKELRQQCTPVDSFTFAGNGEPTLYPNFPEVVDIVVALRNSYYPDAATTLLTNATQLYRPEIAAALHKLDNPTLKLDCGTEEMRQLINRNNDLGCSWQQLIDSLVAFGSDGIIQTLLFDGHSNGKPVSNLVDAELNAYLGHLHRIKPRHVMLYALDRATPEKALRKLSVDELEQYAQRIRNEGVEVKVYG